MGRPLKYLTGIAALSAIIVYCYNNVIGGNNAAVGGAALRKSSSLALSDNEFPRRLTMTEQQRVMEVVKSAWPECVNQRMNGIHCKTFIDEEILSLFTGDDRMTRTILVDKRSILDVFYNSVVILMGDDDIVMGRDGDGMVYYDFLWEGSGEEATPEQCSEIPPVIATQNEIGGNLTIEESPVLVVGDVCDGDGSEGPAVGGVVIPKDTPNCGPDDAANLDAKINAAKSIDIPAAGGRDLPAFDCTCLSGYACCLLIKATVRDADIYNKAIQCHLNFVEGTEKYEMFNTGRGKHVNIFTNHNFVVSIIPEVEGTWGPDYIVDPVGF